VICQIASLAIAVSDLKVSSFILNLSEARVLADVASIDEDALMNKWKSQLADNLMSCLNYRTVGAQRK